jgi:hypothetical protein
MYENMSKEIDESKINEEEEYVYVKKKPTKKSNLFN